MAKCGEAIKYVESIFILRQKMLWLIVILAKDAAVASFYGGMFVLLQCANSAEQLSLGSYEDNIYLTVKAMHE